MFERLQDLAEVHYGKSPAGVFSRDGGVPVVGTGGVYGRAEKSLFDSGIVVPRKGSLGGVLYMSAPFWPVDTTYAVIPKPGTFSRWLFYCLKHFDLEGLNEATGVPSINRDMLYDVKFFKPDYASQKAISVILDTLDTQIRQTEAIIAKLQQVKQGLLHDLLTRGIDESGQLRPPYEQAPELYKESPLGWVPKGWETVSLGDVASRSSGKLQTGPFGSQLHADEYVAEGIPVIMPQDINGERVDRAKVAYITENRAKSLARHRVISNDVVFSRRGDLSRCVAVNEPEVGWVCGTGCLLARFPKNEILGEWLSLTYKKYWSQKQIEGMAVGSTMPNLNTGILANLIISKPSSDEQQSILNYYKESEKCQSFEESSLQKLKKQKAGLMDDLLTGRIRVTDLIDQQQAS